MSALRTMEQDRAAAAWAAVRSVGADYAEKYLALARSAPADLQVNGLGQTLAFWLAKKGPEHEALYRHLSGWVGSRMAGGADLLKWLLGSETGSDGYRRATMEAIAFLSWVKRFAEAEFGGREKSDG